MQGSDFDEAVFFRSIAGSAARALLIGRRALVALGIPVLTADYDFWLHIEDMKTFPPPGPAALARVRALSERVLDAEEFRSLLAVPISEAEAEEARSLIRWFRRRYPTPAERLAYTRRAYRRWTRSQPSR